MDLYTYQIAPDGQSVTLTRRDLPAVADERHYAITCTPAELAEIVDLCLETQRYAKFRETRDGGL